MNIASVLEKVCGGGELEGGVQKVETESFMRDFLELGCNLKWCFPTLDRILLRP